MSLEAFAPTPAIVTLNDGSEVALLPLRLGQMPAFGAASKPVAQAMFTADYLTILDQHPQACIDMIKAVAPMMPAAIAGLYQDEVVRLVSAIFEVNQSFFIDRLRPEMTQAVQTAQTRITTLAALIGLPFSPGSSSTDTTSPPA